MAIVSGASNYKFVDPKLGLSPGTNLPIGVAPWKPGTVYPAGSVVQNGGFLFSTVAGGTSAAAVAVGPTPNGLTDNTVTWVLGAAISSPYQIDSVAQQEIGYQAMVKDYGPNGFGMGFVQYVAFNGTTVPGDAVVIDQYNQTCVQASNASAKGTGGISLGAGAAGKFGWVLIAGAHDYANALNGTSAISVLLGLAATAGRLVSAPAATQGMPGVVAKVTADAQNRAVVILSWPTFMGNP